MVPVRASNEWDPIEEVIVGTVFDHWMPGLDVSFKLFFHDNMFGQDLMGTRYEGDVPIKAEYVEHMAEDLECFVSILEEYGATVRRPMTPKKVKQVKTPYWNSTNHCALNVRDQAMVLGDCIVETPPAVRYRYFENDLMKHLFLEYFKEGARWVCAPRPMILDTSFDFSYVLEHNDDPVTVAWYEKLAANDHEMDCGIEMIFDAANCMRFDEDVVMNVATENQRLGFRWLQQTFPELRFHEVNMVDSHIDSTFVPLCEGLLLVDWNHFKGKDALPEFLQSWEVVSAPEGDYRPYEYDDSDAMLASRSIDINVFSLDPNTIVCHDAYRPQLQPLLKPYSIECVPCRMRHSRIFSGAFHCVTLDIRRRQR